MLKFLGIIPARYASTRFPAKPLAMLGGKTVIQRVYEQVAGILDDAYVATDDERIEEAVKAFGGKVVMTSVNHKSGTDRCYEAYTKIGGDFDPTRCIRVAFPGSGGVVSRDGLCLSVLHADCIGGIVLSRRLMQFFASACSMRIALP